MNNKTIDITTKNIYGKCDYKCNYRFDYINSSCSATNNTNVILLSYDNTNTPQVFFNENKYNVSQVQIFSPSVHLFEGSKTIGEIIIVHTPVLGGMNFNVCIPMIKSGENTKSSTLLSQIINNISITAPSSGEKTVINLPSYNLNTLIPNKPYYSYYGNNQDWILFSKEHGIPVNENDLTKLTSIIQPQTDLTMYMGGNLFYNKNTPNTNLTGKDEIYISCEPTGQSQEKKDVKMYKNKTEHIKFSELWTNDWFLFFIGILLFLCILYFINYSINYVTTNKLPNFSLFKQKS